METNPRIIVAQDHEQLSQNAAAHIHAALRAKPELLLCVASGSTPTRTYQLLGEKCGNDAEPFREMRILKLDEWGGVAMDDPASCETYLRTHLLTPLEIASERYAGFCSDTDAPADECARIHQWLATSGPIDLCILGLGANGHIALNEPGPNLTPMAHVAALTQSSLQHPMLFPARRPPTCGLTLGLAEILQAREIVLLVSGKSKREPLNRLLSGGITTAFPASFLWLHPNWTLLCDIAAHPEPR